MTPITCDEARVLVSDVLARAAAPDQVAAVDAHLGDCAECRGFAEELAAQDLGIREVVARSCEEVSARLHASLASKTKSAPVLPFHRRNRMIWLSAAAAAAVLLGALFFFTRPVPTQNPGSQAGAVGKPLPEEKKPVPPAPTPVPAPKKSEVPSPKPEPLPVPEPKIEKPEGVQPPPVPEEPPKKTAPPPVEPAPPKPPQDPPPAPRKTMTAVAVLEEVVGEVQVVSASETTAARKGATLLAEQGLQTGPLGWAIFRFPDSTRIELWGSTRVSRLADPAVEGKRIALAQGILLADVTKQPADRPLVIQTAQGETKVLGTAFRMLATETETVLEVREGKVRLTRADGKSVDVQGGYVAVAAPGQELRARQQAPKKEQEVQAGVDQKKVDEAIKKGVEWLSKNALEEKRTDWDELVLYTFLHAGVSPAHPLFQTLLKKTVEADLNKLGFHTTYRVSLHAMFLSEFDPVKYQQRIAQCGQLLVDNQCENGQWSYGKPTQFPDAYPAVATGGRKVATPAKKGAPKTEPERPTTVIKIKAQRQGPDKGDNSNSQYAALGLRACMEANVLPPRECLELGRKHWEETQNTAGVRHFNGGWSYPGGGNPAGSMTAGGLGCLIIYHKALQTDWANDPVVKKGITWVSENFSVDGNPKMKKWHLYYLYALERAGVFTQRSSFGTHEWYPEGASKILSLQNGEGSWDDDSDAKSGPIGSTCFAILFLKRGTPPLKDVASIDRYGK